MKNKQRLCAACSCECAPGKVGALGFRQVICIECSASGWKFDGPAITSGCELCDLRAQLKRMMNEIENIPDWFPLIDDALGEAFNKIEDAYGYASHEHDHEVLP